jgi:hypothetical protein
LGGKQLAMPEATKADATTNAGQPTELDAELVKRMLTRHPPLEMNHKKFLGVLYRASDWISADAICREMGIDHKALTGVIGSFGRRCSGTRGWPKRKEKAI